MATKIVIGALEASLKQTEAKIFGLKAEQKILIGAMNKGDKNPTIPTRVRTH